MVKIPKIKFVTAFSLLLSVSVLIVEILLVISCLEIYHSGDSPFTRELVIRHLYRIISPIIVFVVLIILGLVLGLFTNEPVNVKSTKNNLKILRSFYKNFNISLLDADTLKSIKKEYTKRKVFSVIEAFICGISFAVSFSNIVFFTKYTIENHNSDIITMLAFVLPITFFVFLALILFDALKNNSYSAENTAIKSGISKAKLHAESHKGEQQNIIPNVWVTVLRYFLIATGVSFIILGIINGGMADVLGKAVRICTECIGLG